MKAGRTIAGEATRGWRRMIPDQNLQAYRVQPAMIDLGEPQWPDLRFDKILEIAFRERFINSLDHLVLRSFEARRES